MQIGDTSDSYNQLTVAIKDCHTAAIGIEDLDIGNQVDANAALNVIKDYHQTISPRPRTLGATQNRLDHTINNLSVMQENIQDAESTIRDTDVADEMMAYTKNNILIQSAQAMLLRPTRCPRASSSSSSKLGTGFNRQHDHKPRGPGQVPGPRFMLK